MSDQYENVTISIWDHNQIFNGVSGYNPPTTMTTTNAPAQVIYRTNQYGPVVMGAQTLADKTKVLGEDEHHDRLFWKYLVKAGWRKTIIDCNGWAGAIQLVIVHEKCGKVLDTRHLNGLQERDAERFGSRGYVTRLISMHKAKGNCEALPEEDDENE